MNYATILEKLEAPLCENCEVKPARKRSAYCSDECRHEFLSLRRGPCDDCGKPTLNHDDGLGRQCIDCMRAENE